jgi:hypothetical protein
VLTFAQRPGAANSTASGSIETSPSLMALALHFLGANAAARPEGAREQAAKVNFLTGNDPTKWHTGLSTYQEVVYPELWPGIDLVFRQGGGRLKYELVVRPGARVEAIRLAYRGVEGVSVDAGGNLAIRTPRGVLIDERPQSYQEIDGKQVLIETRFVLESGALDTPAFGFSVTEGYDRRYPLIIDPGLGYSTLLGGTSADMGHAIAVDNLGNTYVTGETGSADFPTTLGAWDRTFGGGSSAHGITDAFVAKFGPTGIPIYVTYLGGSDTDVGLGIAVDPSGNAYVTGFTYSANFPVFPNPGAFRTKITGGADAFVMKLNADGSALIYSTFLGGGGFDAGHAIALDPSGNAYVTGETLSSNFPVTPFAVFAGSQGKRDAFVTKLNPGGSALVYSTYLGGKGDDVGFGIAVACLDPQHPTVCNAFVTGQTSSLDFPTTLSFPSRVGASIDTSLSGPTDAFVSKFLADGSQLLYSTFLGGSGDEAGFGIAVDRGGNAYVTGQTNSTNFPFTLGAFQTALNLNAGVPTIDAFVTKINASGTAPFVYSTFLGGSGDDISLGIALACLDPGDPAKCSAVVTGQTSSSNFPTTSGAHDPSYNNNTDAFVTKLKTDGSGLFYSTFLGGSGTDVGGGVAFACTSPTDCNAYVTGETNSHDFPTTTGPPLNVTGNLLNNNPDAFVAKLDVRATTTTTVTTSKTPTVFGESVTFTATVTSPAGTPTGTVTFNDGATALGSGTLNASGQATFTTSSLSVGSSHSITAEYGGDPNFTGSASSPVSQQVSQVSTTTTVTVTPGAPVFGQAVTLTATVAAVSPGAGTPTGTVTFLDGATTLGTRTLSGGSATLTTSALGAGAHAISAAYGGDANFAGSTGTPSGGSLTINQASTTTSLGTSSSPSLVGQLVTFTATVTVVAPGAGTATGTVTFFDGGATLGSGTLNSAGQTTFTSSSLAAGPHSITAQYGGGTSFTGSTSAPLLQTVNPGNTTTILVASVTSTTQGQSITFTATVSPVAPAAGMPTGTVTFNDYNVALGTSTLTSGQATLTTSSLGVGLHSITATYNGNASFVTSTSAVSSSGILAQAVISAPTVISTDRQGASALFASCKSQFVTITGTGFLPPTASPLVVGFTPSSGITVTNVAYSSSTTLVAQVDVGEGAAGSRSVTVVNPDGGAGASVGAILDVPNSQPCPVQGLAPSSSSSGTVTAPVISSLVPSSGLRGSTVTVNGSNFGTAPVVTFTGPGNTPVIATTTGTPTSTAISVVVPAFPTTSADAFDGPVFVTTSGLASNGATFTVTNPRLSVVTPSSASPGSVALDLAGAKLQSGATVQFFNAGTTTPPIGLTVNSVTSDGTGQHLTTGLTATAVTGLLDVVVTNPGGATSRLPGAFQVKAPPLAGFTFAVASADPSTYLPSIDALSVTLDSTGKCTAKSVTPHAVTLTANFTTTVGALPPTQVTFSIVSSNLPGTATNEDCELVTPATSDFSITPLGGAANVTSQQVANVIGGGTYSVTLHSWDWGGNVAISVSGVTTVNGVVNTTVSGTLSLPVDTDGDKLPDAYEANATLNGNAAGQNVLDRLNKDQNGNGINDGDDRFAADGLSNFEKYRGVYLSGPLNGSAGPMTGLTRLGSGLRHLFVRGRGFGNDPAIQAAPGTCGIDPSSGTPQPDANPCPVFQVGAAFFAAGVQVHDVSASFTTGTTFPRQSLANPASPTLDMATIVYDGVNCSAYGCSTSKTGTRNWTFSTLGFSSYGTATAYGADSRVTKKAVDAYFNDRPYQHRTAGLSPCTPSSTTPCYVTSDGTTTGIPMLTPLGLVGDFSNDNGFKDTAKEVVDASGQLLGDTYVAGPFNLQLSAMDANNDGCVELPFVADPRGIPRCNPTADTTLSPQATKQMVIRSLISHELGHNVGINTHTTDATDVMYQSTINWIREGHFSPTAAGLLQIHNKGIQ